MTLQSRLSLEHYLEPSAWIDFDHASIQDLLQRYRRQGRMEEEVIRDMYHFVRDRIHHSCDIQSRRVTAKASEVLQHQEGICYAKAHLLAALLRGMGIPAGLCYQRLLLGEDPGDGYCVHGLNTVYLSAQDRWIRLDARGNKPGIQAEFSAGREYLAYPVRLDLGEQDGWTNYPEPPAQITATLTAADDCLEMCARHLPTELTLA